MFDLLPGTVQSSILSLMLYAIFVSSPFAIEEELAFADNTFILRTGSNTNEQVVDMEKSLEAMMKWMKQSGLKLMRRKLKFASFTNMTVLS